MKNPGRIVASWRTAIVIACSLAVGPATGMTWMVETDGTGDFTIIQDAVDAAAAGDTIYIGPGEYSELHEIQWPYWPRPTRVAAFIQTEGLTFIGAGSDSAVIGQLVYDPDLSDSIDGPIVFFAPFMNDWWRIEGVTIRHGYIGIYTDASVSVENCIFDLHESAAIGAWPSANLFVSESQFNTIDGRGVVATGPIDSVGIYNCTGQQTSFYFEDCFNVIVDGLEQEGAAVQVGGGIHFVDSSGTVSGWDAASIETVALAVFGSGTVEVNESYFGGGRSAIELVYGGNVNVQNSVLEGGRDGVVLIGSGSMASVTGSQFIARDAPSIVWASTYQPSGVTMDFTRNYWGTTDRDSIDAWIIDSSDSSNIGFTIEYEPISDVPLSAEEKSFGSFKALFR